MSAAAGNGIKGQALRAKGRAPVGEGGIHPQA